MGYLRRTLNYLGRITLSNLTHVMSMADLVTINVETPRIESGCYLKKKFIELICMNPSMILSQTVNQVDSCHACIWGPLT